MDEAENGQELKGVGRDLRLAREAAGKQIGEVAQALRIGAYHLEAIETGRYTDLPEAVYVYGFVRSYAGYLQLDASEMVRRVQLELMPEIISKQLHSPAAPQDTPRPSRNLLLLAMFLAVVVIAFWYLNLGFETAPSPQVTGLPSELPADHPVLPPDAPSDAGVVQPSPAAIPAEAVSPQTADVEPAPEPASESPQIPPLEELVGQIPVPAPPQTEADAAATPDKILQNGYDAILAEQIGTPEITTGAALLPFALLDMPEGAVALAPSPPLQAEPAPAPESGALASAPVVLRASADTWIQVSKANGAVLKSWVMRAGEQYVPPTDQTGLKAMIGNAGVLTVYVDGAALPPLGAKGAVIRDLPLDAAELKVRFGG